MGIRASWIAVQGLGKAAVLEHLGFVEKGTPNPERVIDFCCAELSRGWVLVLANNESWISPKKIAALSAHGVAIGCQISETVMYSAAWGYEGGVQQWSMVHYLDEDKELEVEGHPPAEFAAIRDQLTREQEQQGEGVDVIFDVPIALTAALCGFRPDEDVADLVSPFVEVVPVSRGSGLSGWVGKLFRRQEGA